MLRLDLRRCLPATALLLACNTEDERGTGGGGEPTGILTSASSPATASDGTTGTGTGGTGHGGEPTTGAVETGAAETGAVETGADGTGIGSTGPDPPAMGEYAASYIAGEQNHLSVRKADLADDWCVTITLVAPQDMGPLEYDVMLPATWRVQSALIHQGAKDCLSFAGFPVEPIMAVSGAGSASWAGACPNSLAIDITVNFPPDQPWVPGAVLLQAPAVPVTGC